MPFFGASPLYEGVIMKRSLFSLFLLSLMLGSLTACQPRMRSMGASVEPAPIVHRTTADSKESQVQLDVSGFYSMSNETENIDDLNALGGTASFTFRFGGGASFLFFNASLAGFHGKLRFACTEEDCEDPDDSYYAPYKKWLASGSGEARYGFTNLQERLLVGMDFNSGRYMILGFGAGLQAFQGGGEYDRMRELLGSDSVNISVSSSDDDDEWLLSSTVVRNADDRYGFGVAASAWVGFRLGSNSQYGNVSLELSCFLKGWVSTWTNSWRLTYAHPSGFYGGAAWGDLLSYTVYAGKTFVF